MFEFLWEYSNNTYKVQVPLPVHLVLLRMVRITCQVTILGLVWAGLDWASECTQKHGFIFHKLEQTSDTDFQFAFFFWCCYCFLLKSFGNLFILAFIALFSLCTVLHIMKGVNIVLDYYWQVIWLLYSFLLITNSTSVNILGHSSLDSHVFLRISTYCELTGWKRWRIVVLHLLSQCITQSCLTLCDPMGCSMPASLSFTISWSLLTLTSI